MIYTLKSKKPQYLQEMLTERGFSVIEVTEQTLQVEVAEEKKTIFHTVIGVFLSYTLYIKTIRDILATVMIDEVMKDQFLEEAKQSYRESPYWKGLTTVLVADYFETRDSMNTDSFMLFNMKGYKKEIETFVKHLLEQEEEEEPQQKGPTIQEMFEFIRQNSIQNGLNLSELEKLHVFQEGDRLRFENHAGERIDDEFLEKKSQVVLNFNAGGQPELVKDAMLLSSMCIIFMTKRLIVHQGLSTTANDAINDISKYYPITMSLEVVQCGGCSRCHE